VLTKHINEQLHNQNAELLVHCLHCVGSNRPVQLHEEFFQRREAARLYKAKVLGEMYDDRVSVVLFLIVCVEHKLALAGFINVCV